MMWIAGVVVGLAVVLWLVLVIAMRTQNRAVLGFVRRMNRRLANPRVMKSAGTAGASNSVVRHVGRRSGRAYATPLKVAVAGEHYFIVLPYGTSPDWLRNVRAAGEAVLVHDGEEIAVTDPEVLAISRFPGGKAGSARLYGIKLCLRLARSEVTVPSDS